MHSEYVLGIDGGGTKTLAAISTLSGDIVSTGLGGSANFDDVGIAAAQANIGAAFSAACQQAGLPEEPFAAVFLGMAGVVSDRDRAIVRQMALNLRLAGEAQIGIDHDCRIALAGGLSGRPGIVLITGTGSSCYGRTAAGADWRSGGWGYLISDEGSSYWLGLQAMRTAVMVYDGRLPASPLLENVQRYFGLEDMNDLMHRIYVQGLPRSETAALGRLVIQAAQAGDPVSLSLLQKGAQDLGACAQAVANRLGFGAADGQAACEIVLVGGLLKAGDVFLSPLLQAIHEHLPNSRIRQPELPPVAGACLLALQSLGIPIDAQVAGALGRSTLLAG